MRGLASSGALVLALGCARAPAPNAAARPTPVVDDEGRDEPVSPEPRAPTRLRIPEPTTDPAPWVLAPAERVISPEALGETFEDAGEGRSLGLVRWMDGLLVVDATAGVRRSLPLPEHTTWTGVDGSDRIFAATEDGTVWRADAWDAPLARVGAVPGARAWDVGLDAVVAITDEAALRSTDGGEHFEALPALPERLSEPRILTRADGATVVQGQAKGDQRRTYWMPPRQRRWRRGPEDLGPLTRVGAWISDGAYDCGPVLAADGRRWTEARIETELAEWSDLVSLHEELRPGPEEPLPTLTRPAAPRRSADCVDEDVWGGLGMVGTGTGDPEPIRGTSGPTPEPTTRWVRLFSDATCPRDADDEWLCAEGDVPSRLPHLAAWSEDERSLRVIALPSECTRPRRVESAGGLGVLRCTETAAEAVWTLGPDARWHAEGHLGYGHHPPGPLTMAEDGTMLIHGHCSPQGACETSWLRPPEDLGHGRWSPVGSEDALAHRVLDGGRVLRIAGGHDRGYDLSIVDANEHAEPLVRGLTRDGSPLLDVRTGVDRSLHLSFGSEEPERLTLDEHGTLEPFEPPPLRGAWRGAALLTDESYPKVAPLGDVDGDGFSDLAVVQYGEKNRHEVVIVRGWGDLESMGSDGLADEAHVRVHLDVPMYGVDAVRGVGDVDGDGRSDLAITLVVPGTGTHATDGETYVVLGRSTTGPRYLSNIRKGEGGYWIGGFPDDRAYSVRTGPAGDVDGDGRADIGLAFPARGDDPGRLYVVLSKDDPSWIHLGDVMRGHGGFVLRGTASAPFEGSWTTLGDFDGDGGDDLALITEEDGTAIATVLRGGKDRPRGSGSLPDRLAAQGGLALRIDDPHARTTVWRGGDLDGDGRDELVLAQPRDRGLDYASGRVAIVYGRTDPHGTLHLSGDAGLAQGVSWVLGSFAFDEAGSRVSPLGDLDGDGHDELGIAAPSSVRGGVEGGGAYVLRGGPRRARTELAEPLPAALGWHLPPIPDQHRLGTAIHPAGDLDDDGRADFVVTTARHAHAIGSGVVHLVLDRPRE